MKGSHGNGSTCEISDCLRIGERFLLSFDDPELEALPYQGRLQDLRKDGLLCIDAPADVRPPRGTPVTLSSLRQTTDDYTFSSHIHGRGRLKGRVPVLLISPPTRIERTQRRGAYRISVCLRVQTSWLLEDETDPLSRGPRVSRPGVLTNLSGGGAQVFLRCRPESEAISLNVAAPTGFVEELAKRRTSTNGNSRRGSTIHLDPFLKSCEKIRTRLNRIEAQVAHSRIHLRDSRGTIYAVSVSFAELQEICYQLVRYLERQSIRKGLRDDVGDSEQRRSRADIPTLEAHDMAVPAA